ncbi:MAG: hypothetical protein ABIH69_07665 [bacterium]|nr:hypothetical protein [Candidatus Margulisiibacteriota bacterium]
MLSRLVRIKECYSGILCKPRGDGYHQVFLMTTQAKKILDKNHVLQEKITGRNDYINLSRGIFEEQGLSPQFFIGNHDQTTIGFHLFSADEDFALFATAVEQLHLNNPGIHRRVFFKMMGIDIDPKIDRYSEKTYRRVLATLFKDDPSLENFGSIKFVHRGEKKLVGRAPWKATLALNDLSPEGSDILRKSFYQRFLKTKPALG